MKFAILFLLGALALLVNATSDSDATYITNCDVTSPLWGCNPAFWPNGDRLKCMNKTQLMAWASSPVRSACYKLFAGDEAAPLTSYTPGAYMYINLRVICYGMIYRGLLMYATTANNTKVGDWYLPNDEPAWWDLPWSALPGHKCDKSIMHASAALKPYLGIMRFKAPPAGTGTITFKSMVKYGDANTGAFYWPQKDLVLTEGPKTTPPKAWKLTAVGQSCTEFCAASSMYCDATAIQSLANVQTLNSQIVLTKPCNLPYLKTASNLAGSFDPATEYCYYGALASCTAKNQNTSRFCACSAVPNTAAPVTASPSGSDAQTDSVAGSNTAIVGSDIMSDASSMRSGLVSLVLLPLVFLSNGRSAAVATLLLISYSSAHNWINSNSRSVGASTYAPCKPSPTGLPHAQVGPNQAFQIEWMNGHGFFTYFAIVHSSNADKLPLNTVTNLDAYLAAAPNASITPNTGKFTKFHRKETNNLNNDVAVDNIQLDYFNRIIYPNDTLYIYRPPSFKGRIGRIGNPKDTDVHYQMQYKATEVAEDKRVSYFNPKFPWLEAVYKFKITTLNPGRPDTANFYIPGRAGPGRYVVQYYWRGYRDCVDIDLKSTTVASVYGTPPNATRWNRIDHCLFDSPRMVYETTEIVTDAKYCLDRCDARGINCYGVNVVPIKAPAGAYNFPPPAGYNWNYPNIPGTEILVPWEMGAFNATRDKFLTPANVNKYMCYAVMPREFTDTHDDFTVTSDVEDPLFYSTCYYKLQGNMFSDYLVKNPDATIRIPWRFNNKCIDCTTQSTNSYVETVPEWNVAATCTNCDKEPVNVGKPVFPPVQSVEAGVRCDGVGGFGNAAHHTCGNDTAGCVKALMPIGRTLASGGITVDECNIMASQDTECSNTFSFKKTAPTQCYCYTKKACCKTCSRRPDAVWDTFQVKVTADPTCTTGVKSADGAYCCSAECGAGKCTATATIQAPVGFCCSTCITRSCATYGPPCKI
jgi:hypothetical protein